MDFHLKRLGLCNGLLLPDEEAVEPFFQCDASLDTRSKPLHLGVKSQLKQNKQHHVWLRGGQQQEVREAARTVKRRAPLVSVVS